MEIYCLNENISIPVNISSSCKVSPNSLSVQHQIAVSNLAFCMHVVPKIVQISLLYRAKKKTAELTTKLTALVLTKPKLARYIL